MSVVLLDVLRHNNVQIDWCLTGPGDNYCGLAPSFPATFGQMLYQFSDPKINLKGRSTQTLIGGICLDEQCGNFTAVALHSSGCTYTAQLYKNGTLSLLSLVDALMNVEQVTIDSMKRVAGDKNVLHYGLVRRENERNWEADGFRDVSGERVSPCVITACHVFLSRCSGELTHRALGSRVELCALCFSRVVPFVVPLVLPLQFVRPVNVTRICDMDQWNTSTAGSMVPHNCSRVDGAQEPEGQSFLGPIAVAHINASNPDVGVDKLCSDMANALRRSAAALASTQDVVASGLREGAFLSPKPERLSITELVLSIVTAIQGVAVVFVLLFVQAGEVGVRVMRLRHWFLHAWTYVRGLQAPPPFQEAESFGEGRILRLLGPLALAAILFVYVPAFSSSGERSVDGGSAWLALPHICSRRSNPRPLGCPTLSRAHFIRAYFVSARRLLRIEVLPLGFAFHAENEAVKWEGVFAHVDLAVISPGPRNGSIACSAGVPFVVVALVGQARYMKTYWWKLLVAVVVLVPAAGLLIIIRAVTWYMWEEEPQPLEAVANEDDLVIEGVANGEEQAAGRVHGSQANRGHPAGSTTVRHVSGTSSARRPPSAATLRHRSTVC